MAWILKVQDIILEEYHTTLEIPVFLQELMKEEIKLIRAREKIDNDRKNEFAEKINHICNILLQKNARRTEEKLRRVLRAINKQDIIDKADGTPDASGNSASAAPAQAEKFQEESHLLLNAFGDLGPEERLRILYHFDKLKKDERIKILDTFYDIQPDERLEVIYHFDKLEKDERRKILDTFFDLGDDQRLEILYHFEKFSKDERLRFLDTFGDLRANERLEILYHFDKLEENERSRILDTFCDIQKNERLEVLHHFDKLEKGERSKILDSFRDLREDERLDILYHFGKFGKEERLRFLDIFCELLPEERLRILHHLDKLEEDECCKILDTFFDLLEDDRLEILYHFGKFRKEERRRFLEQFGKLRPDERLRILHHFQKLEKDERGKILDTFRDLREDERIEILYHFGKFGKDERRQFLDSFGDLREEERLEILYHCDKLEEDERCQILDTFYKLREEERSRLLHILGPALLPELDENHQGTRLVELSPGSDEFRDVANHMQGTIREHKGNIGGIFEQYDIIKIEKIDNSRLWSNYTHRKSAVAGENGGDANEEILFHGSPFIREIIHSGFDQCSSTLESMLGAGIYFADISSKSNQHVYGKTGCPSHGVRSCYECTRQMLQSRVTLGKPHCTLNPKKLTNPPAGYHSVIGVPAVGGLQFHEYIIYRCEQAYPEYLITYKIGNPKKKKVKST